MQQIENVMTQVGSQSANHGVREPHIVAVPYVGNIQHEWRGSHINDDCSGVFI